MSLRIVQLLSTKIVHFYDKSVKLCQITTNPKTNISGYGAEPNSTLETSTAQYGGPQLSHQIQIAHIKYKLLTSNTNCSRQIQTAHIKYKILTSNTNYSHQKQITHIKYKILTSNTNYAHQKKIAHIKYNYSHQKQIAHIKNKIKRSAVGERKLCPVFTRS